MPFGGYLVKDTAAYVQLGVALDDGDGVTYETGLSPTVYVSKANAVFAARNSATALAYDRGGYYRVHLDTTDTNTYGRLIVSIEGAAASNLHFDMEFWVVSQAEYEVRTRGPLAALAHFLNFTATQVEAEWTALSLTGWADKTLAKVAGLLGWTKLTLNRSTGVATITQADQTTTALTVTTPASAQTKSVTGIESAS